MRSASLVRRDGLVGYGRGDDDGAGAALGLADDAGGAVPLLKGADGVGVAPGAGCAPEGLF